MEMAMGAGGVGIIKNNMPATRIATKISNPNAPLNRSKYFPTISVGNCNNMCVKKCSLLFDGSYCKNVKEMARNVKGTWDYDPNQYQDAWSFRILSKVNEEWAVDKNNRRIIKEN